MKPSPTTVPRFRPLYGWVNRILRVDLSERTVHAHESAPFVPDYLGARGIDGDCGHFGYCASRGECPHRPCL